MKMNISEFAKLCGVSVRTLHYYDEIGLLKPDFIDEQNGYRFYGTNAVQKMQEILFYRELDFSLKDIHKIITSTCYNKQEALKGKKQLLILKRQRLDKIIDLLEQIEKGEIIMNFDVFNEKEINRYKNEVKERWGNTVAYKENHEKTANYKIEDWNNIANGINKIITEFAELKQINEKFDSKKTLALVKKLQAFITDTQYTCTNEILLSLGNMYVTDQRFKSNIDKAGEGTAEFMSKAIKYYCKINQFKH